MPRLSEVFPNAIKRPLGFDDIVHLQKHKGKTIRQVIEEDPEYIIWAHNDLDFVPWFAVEPPVLKEAEEYAAAARDQQGDRDPCMGMDYVWEVP
jgi:hypothetical protein